MLTPDSLGGQCPGSFKCEDAGIICSMDQINGFTCTNPMQPTTEFPLSTLCFGVGVPHNLNWWGFVGCGGPLTLTWHLSQFSCETGQGIQAGVFEGDCTGSRIWDCNPSCNTSSFTLSGNTVPCEVYYVWVDGCNGDVCSYTMSFMGPSCTPKLSKPLPSLFTQDDICPCGDFEVCSPMLGDCNPIIQWRINGKNKGLAGDECIIVPVPENASPGQIIEVCMIATIGNPFNPNAICDQTEVCQNFIVEPITEHLGSCEIVCFEDQPVLWHGIQIISSCISPPCSTRVKSRKGCCIDSLKSFILLPSPAIGRKDTFICKTGLPFRAEDNRVFPGEACDELIEFRTEVLHPACPSASNRCDTSYVLNILEYKYTYDPKIQCTKCSGELSVSLNVNYNTDCPSHPALIQERLIWYQDTSQVILDTSTTDGHILVDKPGRYCAKIEVIFNSQICKISPRICIDVPKDSFPTEVTLQGDTVICINTSTTYAVDSLNYVCSYTWSIPSGNGSILSAPSDAHVVEVFWNDTSTISGQICVEMVTDCGINEKCLTVKFEGVQQLDTDTIILCEGDSILLQEPIPLNNRSWSSGDTAASIYTNNGGLICVSGAPEDSSCTVNKCFHINLKVLTISDTIIQHQMGPNTGSIDLSIQSNDSIVDVIWSNGAKTLSMDSLNAGIYTLTILTESNCLYSFEFEVQKSTGLINTNSERFLISPNPSSKLILQPEEGLSEIIRIRVFTLKGATFVVEYDELPTFDYSGLPNGVYYIQIHLRDGKKQVLKWIKL